MKKKIFFVTFRVVITMVFLVTGDLLIARGQQSLPNRSEMQHRSEEKILQQPTRLISLGGTITETLYALGVQDQKNQPLVPS